MHNSEAWLSLVERCVRDAEVASSNLVASMINKHKKHWSSSVFLCSRKDLATLIHESSFLEHRRSATIALPHQIINLLLISSFTKTIFLECFRSLYDGSCYITSYVLYSCYILKKIRRFSCQKR